MDIPVDGGPTGAIFQKWRTDGDQIFDHQRIDVAPLELRTIPVDEGFAFSVTPAPSYEDETDVDHDRAPQSSS